MDLSVINKSKYLNTVIVIYARIFIENMKYLITCFYSTLIFKIGIIKKLSTNRKQNRATGH